MQSHQQSTIYAASAPRPESRSKQKLLKVRQEMQPTLLSIERQAENIRKLKEGYDVANLKMKEMTSSGNTNLYVKVHGQRASKVYAAIASLLYSTIALTKTDGLEEFIRQTAASLPVNMVDLEEWSNVLEMARETRITHVQLSHPSIQNIDDLHRKLRYANFVIENNPVLNMKHELTLLKRNVLNMLNAYKQEFIFALSSLHSLIKNLLEDRDLSNASDVTSKFAALRAENMQLQNALDVLKRDHDSLCQERDQQAEHVNELQARLEIAQANSKEINVEKQQESFREDETKWREKEKRYEERIRELEKQVQQLQSTAKAISLPAVSTQPISTTAAMPNQPLNAQATVEYQKKIAEQERTIAELVSKDTSYFTVQAAVESVATIAQAKEIEKLKAYGKSLEHDLTEVRGQLQLALQSNAMLEEALSQNSQRKETNETAENAATIAPVLMEAKTEGKEQDVENSQVIQDLRIQLSEAKTHIQSLHSLLSEEEKMREKFVSQVEALEGELREVKGSVSDGVKMFSDLKSALNKVSEQDDGVLANEVSTAGVDEAIKVKEMLPDEETQKIMQENTQLIQDLQTELTRLLEQYEALKAEHDEHKLAASSMLVMKDQEILSLQTKLAILDEQNKKIRRKSVGFAEPLESFHKSPSMQQIAESEKGTEGAGEETSPSSSNDASPRASSQTPAAVTSLAIPPSSDVSSMPMFSPRTAAHYEAQRLVLDYVKQGVAPPSVESLAAEKSNGDVPDTRSQPSQPDASPTNLSTPGSASSANEDSSAVAKSTSTPSKSPSSAKPPSTFISKSPRPPAVRIQSVIRGFLGRRRVRRIITERLAWIQGVLVAWGQTKQGDTGWYTTRGSGGSGNGGNGTARDSVGSGSSGRKGGSVSGDPLQDQLFYFCKGEGDFLLLCGPIIPDVYHMAVKDMVRPGDSRSRLEIDRVALQATRIQIDTLLADIQERDEYIATLELKVEDLQKQNSFHVLAIKEYEESIRNLKDVNAELEIFKERHVKDTVSMIQQKIAALTQAQCKLFNKVTAVARGFLSRRRVRKIRLAKIADDTGVLVAMDTTKQGETGWYLGPNGSIYYFVLKDGNWFYAAGPLTEADFKATYLQSIYTGKQIPPNKILTRCAFKLGTIAAPNSEVYIANRSGRLYLALAVDYLIPELMQGGSGSLMQGSLMQGSLEASIFSGEGLGLGKGGVDLDGGDSIDTNSLVESNAGEPR